MHRRRFLYGLGGISVALPVLGAFGRPSRARAGGARPTRMLVMAYPMGTYVPYWMPSATGASFELGPITQPLAGLESRCLFLSNFDNGIHQLCDAHRFGHPGKEQTTLTGTLTLDALAGGRNEVDAVNRGGGADGGAGGPSIEEVVGQYLRQPHHSATAINLAVNGRPDRRRGLVDANFFHEGAGTPATLQADVGQAFNDLFGSLAEPDAPVDPAIAYLHERNRSVLDAVRESFTDLRQGLGTADRRTLDEHMSRIRRLELDVMRVACGEPTGVGATSTGTSMSELAPIQNRIAAAALGCDMAPVARIQCTDQQNPRFGIPTVDDGVAASGEDWHALVHRTDDTRPARVEGYRFFVDMFAHLLRELDAIPDGPDGGSLLDSSLVMLASNFGPGNGHAARKMCFLLAGNLGGARTGWHFDARRGDGFYGDTTHHVNHIHNSVLRMVGVTAADGSPLLTHGLRGFADDQVIDEIFV